MENLIRIELSENNILDDLSALCNCPKLQEIDLAGNKIADVDMLKPLADLKDLKILDLFGCPITESDDYRQKVFNLLPQLELLDRADKDGKEVEVESEDQDDEEEDSEEEVGLDYLNQDLKDEEEEEEYEPEDVEEEEEELSEDEEDEEGKVGETSTPPSKRTKTEEE